MKTPNIALAALVFSLASGFSTVRAADSDSHWASQPQRQAVEDAYALETEAPRYPSSMLRHGKQGKTLLKLRVSATGEVSGVQVIASTSEAFSEAAIHAVKNWYFEPGKRDGVPIAQTVVVPVEFIIDYQSRASLASL